ncbi:unnamed protein product [Effrenium voratum]|nr:unnamed protein product [Effrenium voratum]
MESPDYHILPSDDSYKSLLSVPLSAESAGRRGSHAQELLLGALGGKGSEALSSIEVAELGPEEYRLRVEGILGEFARPDVHMSVNLRVHECFSIKDVKARLWEVCELNPFVLQLYWKGEPLPNEAELAELCYPQELHGTRFYYNPEAGLRLMAACGAGDLQLALAAMESHADPNYFRGEDGFAPIHAAAQSQNPDILQFLLRLKAFSEQKTVSEGLTPLHYAARSGRAEVASMLLAARATPHRQDHRSMAALHYAAEAGNAAFAEVLLDAKAEMDQHSRCWAPMHIAIVHGHLKVVELLCKRGADLDVRTLDDGRSTPLHLAAAGGQGRMISVLSKGGATPDLTLEGGWAPLHVAALLNRKEVIKVIIRGKADPQKPLYADGVTALHVATAAKHSEIVNQLLKAFADPEAKMTGSVTALHLAAATGAAAPAKALLQNRAFVDVNRHVDKCTPLLLAAEHGMAAVAQTLLEATANADFRRVDGYTSLHLAAGQGNTELCRILLEAKASCDLLVDDGVRRASYATKPGGQTALHLATEGGFGETAAELLAKGADIHRPSGDGRTPLHVAAYRGFPGLCRALLEARAESEATMPRGWTAMHVAAHYGHLEVLEVLLRAGAALEAATEENWTPLFMAAKERNGAVEEYLLHAGAQLGPALAAAERAGLELLHRRIQRLE